MLLHLLRKHFPNLVQIKQIHAQLIVTSLITDDAAIAAILRFFTENPDKSHLGYAVAIFDQIESPTTFAWNTLIRASTQSDSIGSALRFYIRMRGLSIPLDTHTFPFVLKACAVHRDLHMGQAIHSESIKFGFDSDIFVHNNLLCMDCDSGSLVDAHQLFVGVSKRDTVTYNTMIDGYVKSREINSALKLFDEMPSRDVMSWGTILAGCAQNNRCREVVELFRQMVATSVSPDNIALTTALSGCGQLGALKQGRAVHSYIARRGIRLNVFLCTGLIDMYAKCGRMDIALRMFDESPDRNFVTWNAIIMGMAMHGDALRALSLFHEMQETEIEPDGITFLGVLVACSHAGLVGLAHKYFVSMETVYKIRPELKHYGCMSDILGRVGLLSDAEKMIKEMPMKPDVFVWGGLLGGCRIHGNVNIAENAMKHLLELDPEDSGIYSIMANIYAAARRWEDVARIRKLMNASRVKKLPGCSFIEINGLVHEFVAAEGFHSQIDEICAILEAFSKQLKVVMLNDLDGYLDFENEV